MTLRVKISIYEFCRARSVVSDSVTSLTVAYQASLSMEFSRQEYWSGLPFPTPGDLPDPRIKPAPLAYPALSGRFFTMTLLGTLWNKILQDKSDLIKYQKTKIIFIWGIKMCELNCIVSPSLHWSLTPYSSEYDHLGIVPLKRQLSLRRGQ